MYRWADAAPLAAREAGKTVPDSIAEVREAIDFLRYYAKEARQKGFELSEYLFPTIKLPTGKEPEPAKKEPESAELVEAASNDIQPGINIPGSAAFGDNRPNEHSLVRI